MKTMGVWLRERAREQPVRQRQSTERRAFSQRPLRVLLLLMATRASRGEGHVVDTARTEHTSLTVPEFRVAHHRRICAEPLQQMTDL